ncbi:G-protein coupled receptor family C group 6 member A-like isoform X3 [Hyla sarda]|uniref:G-protein coupled receptor family C group 6 member A-like isoform X3 n=1 Tax=Hyla sarda TaxID=327740 RepID=UPI0024C3B5CE|nr:G-protein coupled receptor family C group 6 member A-like isoform X3 [Hyla sarda]
MVEALSMIYAIEKVNNSTLLEGIKLGYELYDTCSVTLKAVQATLNFIPEFTTMLNSTDCSNGKYIGPIKAVVGETYSEISIAVSQILGLYLIPQISPASSAAALSDKIRFPSFLRTIPSDTHQTKAIVELIKTFKWNWVGIISSDDEYGKSAQDSLNSLLKLEGICTAFSKTVPSYVDHPLLQASLDSALLEKLKNGTFSFNGETYQFDSSGDLLTGYDVITWHFTKTTSTVQIVGKYDISEGKISINRSFLQWNTNENQVPFSNCSRSCNPGYFKKYSYISCCYECVPCAKDDYSPIADMTECLKCSSWQWSTNGSDRCTNRTIKYFDWKDPYAITLMAFSAFGVALVIMTIVLFAKHFNTPAVKAAGGYYTFLLNISLLVNLVSIVFFIGEPNNTICKIRQPFYGISFTFSVSCIMIKSIRILLTFESAKRRKVIVKFKYLPIVIIMALTGVQVLICTLWLSMDGPYRQDITMNDLIIVKCDEGSYQAFGIMLGYIGLLALICFLLAYKGRKLPEKYNEARCITFSMLVYMFVWILFIPVYINTTSGMYDSAVQAVAILASIYGVISCHLLQGCYILIFKRETCTREKYLQSIFSFYRARRKVQSLCKSQFNLEIPTAAQKQDIVTTQVAQEDLGSKNGLRKRHNSC